MRIWPALEFLAGPAALLTVWRKLLSDDVQFVMPYLQPRPGLAMSYPRLEMRYPWDFYRVVIHGPDHIVGVCDETHDRIELTKKDLVIYEINWPKLLGDIAVALNLERIEGGAEAGPDRSHLVGYIRPSAGFKFPVYLVAERDAIQATNAIRAIATSGDGPFALLMPTHARLRNEGQQVLDWKKSCCLALSESLAMSEPGKLVATDAAKRILQVFTDAHVPACGQTERVYVPTPPDARWRDVSLRFVDGHTLAVRVGALSRTFHYTQLGMADGRNAKPTKQWELLTAFARNGGVLTWRSADASRKNKKRRELLTRDLKALFRIEGEPIEPTEDGKGWRTAFAFAPDR